MSMSSKLAAPAQQTLRDASWVLIFDEKNTVLHSSSEVNLKELAPLKSVLEDRESAIRNGIVVQGRRYEVHRYHPPLAYGRSMDCPPETSEGCALCKVTQGPAGSPVYALITYEMPNISARMVSQLVLFCRDNLGAVAT